MTNPGLEGEKESHTALVVNSTQKEDSEMYSQLPDYDVFQWYYMEIDAAVSQIAQKVYANFHKPSWQTSKRHSLMAKIAKKLLRGAK